MPNSVRIDHTVLHALNNPTPGLPATTKIQLHIASVTSKISTALGECETSTTGLMADPLPLVRVFETELSMIQDRYAGEWSPAEEVSFLDARLSLYCYVLDQVKHQPLESLRPVNQLIAQSSITARQLLIVVTTLPDVLSKGVFHVFRCASYAAFFLLRLLGMAPRQLIDETDTRNIIRQTFALMRDLSQTGNDRRFQCMRVCRIIEHMIDHDWDTDMPMPFTSKAESFMANNFVADVAARGIFKANQQNAAAQTERDCRISEVPGVPAGMESDFDLDLSIWDPMAWTMNWDNIDDLLLPSANTGGGYP